MSPSAAYPASEKSSLGFIISRRRRRNIDLALSVRLFVRTDVRSPVRHELVGAISQRL